ncbi:MAG: hypothetical protein DRH44_04210 [Candidatus Coatesbacteria bacterium]|nr:MAG: hypothetical protein DRH44_04210 [Candidatus Coatesbacteria bacterium]
MAKKIPFRKIALIMNISAYLVGSIFGGLVLGLLIDKMTGKEPLFTLIFLFVGSAYGIYKTIMIGIMLK